jgi:lipopolysaccharide assembly outer membrane protein LptD (OstA)
MYDSLEYGERISFGVENSIYDSKRRWLNFFVGKSQNVGRSGKNKKDDRNSTVGRFLIKPFENISFRTRFTGIPLIEKSKMLETGMSFDIKRMSMGVGYLYESRTNEIRDKPLSQLGLNLGYKVTRFWRVSGSKVFNFKKDIGRRHLSQGVFLDYEDECFSLGFGLYNSKFKDKDIKPNTGFVLTIIFKNLGGISKHTSKYLYQADMGMVE